MKIIRSISMLALLMILGACENNRNIEPEEVVVQPEMDDPDMVFTEWEDAWNSGNAGNILRMTADDAVLVMNGTEVSRDSVASWIEGSSAVMRDLQLEAIEKNTLNNVAYEVGTFDHGIMENDSLRFAGTYTFIYEKPEGSEQWEVKVMNINDRVEQDTMSNVQ